jgi:hypothetical protein
MQGCGVRAAVFGGFSRCFMQPQTPKIHHVPLRTLAASSHEPSLEWPKIAISLLGFDLGFAFSAFCFKSSALLKRRACPLPLSPWPALPLARRTLTPSDSSILIA